MREKISGSIYNQHSVHLSVFCVFQPHNNRFMICCDSCLDWYHGKCVGITKKMGKEMEEAGNEWTCPNCKDPTGVAAQELAASIGKSTLI